MQSEKSTFQVYNASAGSGKTFTLVKEYLKIILQSDDKFTFQKILAVTFTNKASAEMKTRILDKLKAYSEGKMNDDMCSDIIESTGLSKQIIRERSEQILDEILKNYTAFSITTIDSFTHKIIKNFSYDLGLSLDFEVEMDATELLSEAVDLLISKIGLDDELTKVLIDFSLEKADDDRAWDISRELNEFAKLLLNEDDAVHFKSLANKTLSDFYKLKEKLLKLMKKIEGQFRLIANDALLLIEETGLRHSDFSGRDIPKFFKKLQSFRNYGVENINFEGNVQKMFLGERNLYSSKADFQTKRLIQDVEGELGEFYFQAKQLYNQVIKDYTLAKLTMKSIVPLAVLNNINSELNYLKDENNLRLNSEFNHLISENIKDQPAPFIYERIGQRFMHYFIDEMQDTSVLQWQNMIPLIDNALAQENSDLMLVGDGKQAIYRWRGGRAEQFIGLGTQDNGANPFVVPKSVKNLKTNYRSYSEIIDFTNKFFQHTANFINKPEYKKLYIDGNHQLENSKKGGCVSFSFVTKKEDLEEHENRYAEAVFERIYQLQSYGFSKSDICILVRKRREGVIIANYLTNNGIGVVSSETLLLENSSKVNFLISFFQMILHPLDKNAVFDVLYFLTEHLKIENKHKFIQQNIDLELNDIFKALNSYDVDFSEVKFSQLPLYEKVEYLIRSFKLLSSSDAYVQFFLDVVLEQQHKGLDLQEFLEFWELKKDKLSISVTDTSNKVQIMTIHKSKGLEFPVVIFPCDLDIYRQKNPKAWLDKLPLNYRGFKKLLLNYTKDFQYTGERGAEIYKQIQEELELDNFNLLYVALTRPIEQLHIISEDDAKENHYAYVFKTYIEKHRSSQLSLFDDTTIFGDLQRVSNYEKQENKTIYLDKFISTSIDEHAVKILPSSSKYWDTEQGRAIEYGNQIHEVLAQITYADELETVLNRYLKQGFISVEQADFIRKSIQKIISDRYLRELYCNKNYKVYNERELLKNGRIFIPDRLVFSENKVIIIDYKTGSVSNSYKEQVYDYGLILKEMGYVVSAHILIYLNDEIEVVRF